MRRRRRTAGLVHSQRINRLPPPPARLCPARAALLSWLKYRLQTTARESALAAHNGLSVECLAPVRGCCAASASSSARHAEPPITTTVRNAKLAMLTRIPTGGLQWRRGTCHRTGCLPTPAVRGRRKHCMGLPARAHLPIGPTRARQRQRGAVHLVRGPGDGQCRQLATVVHSHTWYTALAGHHSAILYDIPHVLTFSLEPCGPWSNSAAAGIDIGRADRGAGRQRGRAVSSAMQRHVAGLSQPGSEGTRVCVIRNRIDTETWYPAGPAMPGRCWPSSRSIEPAHGGIRRADHPAKGVVHLVTAAHRFRSDVQLVLCAGAADTPE